MPAGTAEPVALGLLAADRLKLWDPDGDAPRDHVPVPVEVEVEVGLRDRVAVLVRVLVLVDVTDWELVGDGPGVGVTLAVDVRDGAGVVEGVWDGELVSEGLGDALRTGSQKVHPTGAYCPTGHGVHAVALLVSLKVSSGHGWDIQDGA